MKRMIHKLVSGLCLLGFATAVFGQGKPYEGPEDPEGDISSIRAGYMNQNRVYLYFENTTQLSDWWPGAAAHSKWPNDYTGTQMTDEISVVIGAEAYVKQDSVPVTDSLEVRRLSASGEIDTLLYIQTTGYATFDTDKNYDGTVEWGFYPVPGYCNETQDYPAMSNKPDSWPPLGWPSTGFEKKWPGEWNGRFGRGVKYAALESYFVANDAQDMEKVVHRNDPQERLITDGPRYLPRPGVRIGDINSDVTIQKGLPWGGLGLRVDVRGYQWDNPEAKDILFWEYNISNISDYDLLTCGFGYYVDCSIGGNVAGADDERGYFNKDLNLSYVWENTGIGEGGRIPGMMGFAYLESPGIAWDGTDNDNDGLVNEKRDNKADRFVGASEGVADPEMFKAYYHTDLKPHWDADEDQDWQDGSDPDGDGRYADPQVDGTWKLENGAYTGDDLGLDGVGPSDLNYSGPDEGECNHRPDFTEGVGCEPNFAATDINEADMLGLTQMVLFDWNQWNNWQIKGGADEKYWKIMNNRTFTAYFAAGAGAMFQEFASTSFPFYKGRTERISMAILFTYEDLANLRAPEHKAPKMFKLKETAQVIYERDYRFAQAPLLPTLKATPGDGKVVLSWDDISDKRTHEPFLQNKNDFEGYKLYRTTDKLFSDAYVITDSRGDKSAPKPIFQCDLIDNIKGNASWGIDKNGYAFYLGDDTGITHHFVDEMVQNGVTYYYWLGAYDYGIRELDLAPAEEKGVLELNESEAIVRIGKNVQVVTPHARAAGYISPSISVDAEATAPSMAGGLIVPSVQDPGALKPGHTYRVSFSIDTVGHLKNGRYRHPMDAMIVNNGLFVWDVTDGDQLVYSENPEDGFISDHLKFNPDKNYWQWNKSGVSSTDIVDGVQLTLQWPVNADSSDLDPARSGWVTGSAPITVTPGQETRYFAWEYEIVFTGGGEQYATRTTVPSPIYRPGGAVITKDSLLLNQSYDFYIVNKNSVDSAGSFEKLDLVCFDLNNDNRFGWKDDLVLAGHAVTVGTRVYWGGTVFAVDLRNIADEPGLPGVNDVYRVVIKRPLMESEKFVFTVRPETALDQDALKTDMDSIKVVPNPYIATNAMEPSVVNKYLNQRRQLMFTHVPADCIIRIFTPTGVLVNRIDARNRTDDGAVHWDLLSKEGLEIAAGMYVYQILSSRTGGRKIGKFAVIK